MKKLLLISALLCSGAQAEFYDGNRLLSKLSSVNAIENIAALGYITGVSDALHGVLHCPPDSVTAGQMNDMVKNSLQEHPETRHYMADVLVGRILKASFPCAKKGTGV